VREALPASGESEPVVALATENLHESARERGEVDHRATR
jgi:hypothetical protein